MYGLIHATKDRTGDFRRSPRYSALSKARLFGGVVINVVGAIVLFSGSFRFLNPSL